MPQLLSASKPTARKQHRCEVCRILIEPGTTYWRDSYVYDGRAYAWKVCQDCGLLTGDVYFWAGSPDEGVGAEDYQEWANEHVDHPDCGEHARALLARMHPGAVTEATDGD